MLYTPLTKKALAFSYQAHHGVNDRTGVPYIFHPYEVALQLNDEVEVAAALLHDVVEDTEVTFDDLLSEGFPEEVVEVVRLLTHDDDVDYADYILSLKASGNARAIRVKLADLNHNSNLLRIDEAERGSEKTLKRMAKYRSAQSILSGE